MEWDKIWAFNKKVRFSCVNFSSFCLGAFGLISTIYSDLLPTFSANVAKRAHSMWFLSAFRSDGANLIFPGQI